jgi:hypothetical protein
LLTRGYFPMVYQKGYVDMMSKSGIIEVHLLLRER